jgi:RNA polymerase sigma factor (sigma-70 family)
MDSARSGVDQAMVVAEFPGALNLNEFTAFYQRELGGQVRRATLLIGDADAAQDLVHDAFAEVYARWGSLGDPGPYLNVAVINRCRSYARRRATVGRKLPLLIPDPAPEDELLWDAVQRLPFNQRAAVVLRFYHQMTEREIADVLRCRLGSIGPWLRRGLDRLRRNCSEHATRGSTHRLVRPRRRRGDRRRRR